MTRKSLRPFVAIALVALFSGCVKSRVCIHLNHDGSGYIVVSRLYDRHTVHEVEKYRRHDTLRSGKSAGPGKETAEPDAKDAFFDMALLRREAVMYGADVNLLGARRMDVDGGRGHVAVYGFKSINDVAIVPGVDCIRAVLFQPQCDAFRPFAERWGGDDDVVPSRTAGDAIEFSLQTGAVSRLRIIVPQEDRQTTPGGKEVGNGTEVVVESKSQERTADADELDWYWPSVHDDRLGPESFVWDRVFTCDHGDLAMEAFAVQVNVVLPGKVVSSNAAHVDPANSNRIVLLDVDATRSRHKKDVEGLRYELSGRDIGKMLNRLAGIGGSAIETNREVCVEFSR